MKTTAAIDEDTLISLCESCRVRQLDVFGSAATGDGFDPRTSDLDFLVEYRPLDPEDHARAYFDLLEGLRRLFDRPVDLVVANAIRNKYFRRSVEKSRMTIYAA